jgi:hypothetical protein
LNTKRPIHARLLLSPMKPLHSPIIWIGKSREMTCRSQVLPWRLGEGEVKTTDNKIHWPVATLLRGIVVQKMLSMNASRNSKTRSGNFFYYYCTWTISSPGSRQDVRPMRTAAFRLNWPRSGLRKDMILSQ